MRYTEYRIPNTEYRIPQKDSRELAINRALVLLQVLAFYKNNTADEELAWAFGWVMEQAAVTMAEDTSVAAVCRALTKARNDAALLTGPGGGMTGIMTAIDLVR